MTDPELPDPIMNSGRPYECPKGHTSMEECIESEAHTVMWPDNSAVRKDRAGLKESVSE